MLLNQPIPSKCSRLRQSGCFSSPQHWDVFGHDSREERHQLWSHRIRWCRPSTRGGSKGRLQKTLRYWNRSFFNLPGSRCLFTPSSDSLLLRETEKGPRVKTRIKESRKKRKKKKKGNIDSTAFLMVKVFFFFSYAALMKFDLVFPNYPAFWHKVKKNQKSILKIWIASFGFLR